MTSSAPFPYFGGKSGAASIIWRHFGEVQNYIEPFCGSAAALLACPYHIPIVTLNDADGFICNVWRAIVAAPDKVAKWADWPVNENDLFARHVWLIRRRGELVKSLEIDPDYYDAKIAGWWIWGACAWIGTGWCSGEGPWTVEGGEVVKLGDAGQGVNRQLPHLGDAGQGVNRKLPHLGNAGQGTCEAISTNLHAYMQALSDKLRRARVTCGDWRRVTTPIVTHRHGLTAILLDPPYGEGEQEYSVGGNGDKSLAWDVWRWAVENGNNPELRIAVCGYEDRRELPPGWFTVGWKARKGYQLTDEAKANPDREVIYFSPHCKNKHFRTTQSDKPVQLGLLEDAE